MEVKVQTPAVQVLLRKLINRHEGHAIPVPENDELKDIHSRLPRVEHVADGDLVGSDIQQDLRKHRGLMMADTYLSCPSVRGFVKITKHLSSACRTKLLKWARCHFPRAKRDLPAGEWRVSCLLVCFVCFTMPNSFTGYRFSFFRF